MRSPLLTKIIYCDSTDVLRQNRDRPDGFRLVEYPERAVIYFSSSALRLSVVCVILEPRGLTLAVACQALIIMTV